MSQHILFLSHEFPPDGGGAGVNLALLCEALQKKGVSITTWVGQSSTESKEMASQVGGSLSPKSLNNQFVVTTKRSKRFQTSSLVHFQFIWGALRLARKTSLKPDWIIGNMALPGGIAAVLVSRILGAPIAIWHHGSDVHGGFAQGAKLWQRYLLRFLWARSQVNFFVAPSLMALASTYGEITRPRILPSLLDPVFAEKALDMNSTPNGVGCGAQHQSEADPPMLKTTLENKLEGNIKVTQGYFLILGRLEPVKNPLLAIEAYALYLQGYPTKNSVTEKNNSLPLGLRIVGDGSLREVIKQKIVSKGLTKHVTLESPIPRNEVIDLLSGACALLMPSKAEGMSLTVIEAAALGVPCIAAASLGLVDLIQGNFEQATTSQNELNQNQSRANKSQPIGMLFNQNDVNAFSDCLTLISSKSGLRQTLSQNAKQSMLRYTPDASASIMLDCLNQTATVGSAAHRQNEKMLSI